MQWQYTKIRALKSVAIIIMWHSYACMYILGHNLSSVMDLEFHVNDTFETAIITWRPPASLNMMEVSDDLTFCVEVTSLEVCNVTDTEFEFSLPPMSWCGLLVISVTPINLAGRGPPSETVYVPELNGKLAILI